MTVDVAGLRDLIRDIPGFPSPGILFKDITPLLGNGPAWRSTVDALADFAAEEHIDHVIGIEARGFVVGAPVAYRLGCGFVPVRKPGKLPHTISSVTYDLEYGTDTLEMHTDAFGPGERVLIVDDVLATGGTAAAAVELVRRSGAEVAGLVFLIELTFLAGRTRLDGQKIHSLITF